MSQHDYQKLRYNNNTQRFEWNTFWKILTNYKLWLCVWNFGLFNRFKLKLCDSYRLQPQFVSLDYSFCALYCDHLDIWIHYLQETRSWILPKGIWNISVTLKNLDFKQRSMAAIDCASQPTSNPQQRPQAAAGVWCV